MPLISLLGPWTLRLPDPLFVAKFTREAKPGTDSPPELMFLPKLPPPTMVPIELASLGPTLPKTGDTPKPGTELRLPVAEFGEMPEIDPPIPFILLLPKEWLPTLIPPLFVTPEPWVICMKRKKKEETQIPENNKCKRQ